MLEVGNYWSISRMAVNGQTAESKKIDADMGAALP